MRRQLYCVSGAPGILTRHRARRSLFDQALLFTQEGHHMTRPNTCPNPISLALIEDLECRKHLSVSLGQDGTLMVQGTERSDHITVYLRGTSAQRVHVKLNNKITAYDLNSISNIVIKGRRGNDRITLDQQN